MDDLWQQLRGMLEGSVAYCARLGVVAREFLQPMQFVETLNELLPWEAPSRAHPADPARPGRRFHWRP